MHQRGLSRWMAGRILVCGWEEETQRGKFVLTLKDREYFWGKILLMYVRVLDDDNSRISATFSFLARAHYWALLCDLTFRLSMFKWVYKSDFWQFLQMWFYTQAIEVKDECKDSHSTTLHLCPFFLNQTIFNESWSNIIYEYEH